MEFALSNRLTLIQGPPGTGKTHVGVQIVRALLENMPESRVLCLCYTNHALDDFLLSLHEDGLPLQQMVRLGGSPKIHDRLKDRCLNGMDETQFDRIQSRHFASLKQHQERCNSNIELLRSTVGRRAWGRNWWNIAGPFLQREHNEEYLQLVTVTSVDDGMCIVGKKGKAIAEDYYWQEWCSGGPIILNGQRVTTGIWALSKTCRKELIIKWQNEYERTNPKVQALASEMNMLSSINEEMQLLRSETKVKACQQCSIVGCTTTSAAKHKDLIEQISPSIVIVEEAAEILEASILTSVGRSVNQLVMIGDHKQLRPKLECYSLRKESGRGVDFDISLFERLANQPGFPVISLTIQYRMRPEISELVRNTTYPYLEDSSTVLNRDDLRGVAPNSNVIFVNHNEYESNDDDKAAMGGNSKVNWHEVSLTVSIVKYMLQQGYTQSEIVVLTPYLGQLVLIQKALSGLVAVDINERDYSELKRFGVDLAAAQPIATSMAKPPKPRTTDTNPGAVTSKASGIRVSTIDNFQGEESRIVVCSLVRANADGDIGFVAGAERVNVLLSRARDALILLGCKDTFLNAKSSRGRALWTGLLNSMLLNNQIYEGFPAVCQTHNVASPVVLCRSELFDLHAPDGGCCAPCGVVLPTCPLNHKCPKKCHVLQLTAEGPDSHASMLCLQLVPDVCTSGHAVKRVCCESASQDCQQEINHYCPEGHPLRRKCYQPERDCRICADIIREESKKLKELYDEEVRQAEALRAAQASKNELFSELQRGKLMLKIQREACRIEEEKQLMKNAITENQTLLNSVWSDAGENNIEVKKLDSAGIATLYVVL